MQYHVAAATLEEGRGKTQWQQSIQIVEYAVKV